MATRMGASSFNGGMPSADRPSRGTAKATLAGLTAARPKPSLKKVWPEIWKLVKPRRALLGGSFGLMVINRASGLVLPGSTKTLIDKVMYGHQMHLLPWIVGIVLAATLLQGATSYALTQLLSKAGQCNRTLGGCRWRSTTKTAPGRWWRGS
jgi:ABC-type bacteriocin/lantibiotic exporter with double-glycine peptidase domain